MTILTIFCIVIQAFKEDAGSSKSDFSVTVKAYKYFIDKTLLIKDFLNDSPHDFSVKLITAPTGFGKSTVIDMVKTFAGIVADSKGNQITPNTTQNYKLFCDPPLNICRDKTYVEKHLGQHPIIHIDYIGLSGIRNFKSLLDGLRNVLRVTFKEHKYLLLNSTLFRTAADKDLFIKYCDAAGTYTLTESNIRHGFEWLPALLYAHFGKNVIVLLDEYDSYYSSLLLHNVDDSHCIIRFLTDICEGLFRYNTYLGSGLLTGVLHVESERISLFGKDMDECRFLGDHKFSRYYGFTEKEVNELLKRNIQDDTKIEETRKVLNNYYDGYFIRDQNTKVYSIWSVLNFFEHKMKPDNYCVRTQYIDSITDSFKIKKIFHNINKLLHGDDVGARIDAPLSRKEILILNEMNRNLVINNEYEIELFYQFLFDLGFLSQEVEDRPDTLIIPNFEIQMEFGRLMAEHYERSYNFLPEYIRNYQNAFNYFVPGKNFTTAFKIFFRTVYDLFHHSENHPLSENDVQSVLLAYAAAKFPLGKRSRPTYEFQIMSDYEIGDKQIKIRTGRIGRPIIVLNSHRMAIVIATKFKQSKKKLKKKKKKIISVDKLAEEAHKQILNTYHPYIIHKNNSLLNVKNINGAVYIGLGFDGETRNISIVCSETFSSQMVTTTVTN